MASTRCQPVSAPRRIGGHAGSDAGPRSLLARLRAWLSARRSLKTLLALDDRTLRDIGLTRRALARHYRRRHFWW